MDFLVGIWIIYLIGSFIFSFIAPKKGKSPFKSNFESVEKFDKLIEKERERKKEESSQKRNSNIQKRNQNVQALRQRQANKQKDNALAELNSALTKATDSLNPTSSIKQDEEMDFTTIADYDDAANDSFGSELKNAEQYLDQLDDWYGDESLADASWMELDDDQDILLDQRHNGSYTSKQSISDIQKSLKHTKQLRKVIIMNEIINRPLSLRNQ